MIRFRSYVSVFRKKLMGDFEPIGSAVSIMDTYTATSVSLAQFWSIFIFDFLRHLVTSGCFIPISGQLRSFQFPEITSNHFKAIPGDGFPFNFDYCLPLWIYFCPLLAFFQFFYSHFLRVITDSPRTEKFHHLVQHHVVSQLNYF